MTRQLSTGGAACYTPILAAFQSESSSHAARAATVLALLCAALLITSCVSSRLETNTGASSTEQLLLAESVERAIAGLELPDVRGKRVFVDFSAIPSQHELRIVAQVGSIGTDARRGSFGLPSIPIPPIGSTPDLPLISVVRQRGWTRVRVATWDGSGRLVAVSPTVTERARYDVVGFLFELFEIRHNDVYPPSEQRAAAVEEARKEGPKEVEANHSPPGK